jgi:hypothetical protein
MSSLRDYLCISELATYEKTFPVLTVPTLGSDSDGYLKNLAEAAIEQTKFLNTFAGIPIDVLYENVGQKHKASNLMALSVVKKTGNDGADFGLIDIPGDGESGSYSNIFLTDEATGEEVFPELLWKAQSDLLERQISYLKDIKETYAEKRQDLPQGFSMRSFVQSDFFKWAIEFALTLIPGDIDDAIYKAVQTHAHKVVGWALVWLQKAYYAGSLLCAAMADENAYLKRLEKSRDNYELRSKVISQHDQSIQSMLQQVALAESQAAQMAAQQTIDEEKRAFMKEALSERIFECPYTGLCLGEKNGVADESEFSLA